MSCMLLFPPPPLPPPFPRNRSLTGMVGTIKNFLSSCQKKTDFKPDDMALPGLTEACQKVVAYIMECRRVLDQSLDGKNLEVVLLEFGIRIQKVIYDHVQQFVISENGLCNYKITFNFTTLFFYIHLSLPLSLTKHCYRHVRLCTLVVKSEFQTLAHYCATCL